MSTANSFVTDDGVRLVYQVEGKEDGPPLLFINSLGTDMPMWEPQVAQFRESFRLVRYDTRGHGRSDAAPRPHTIERLGTDALALLDELSVERAHVCGLSLGGLTALWLAIYHPERLRSAIFANTGARIGTVEGWNERIEAIRVGGMSAVRQTVLERFFSPRFRDANPQVVDAISDTFAATDPVGYMGACMAVRDADLRSVVSTISVPSLIIVGTHDEATPPSLSEELHNAIPGSKLIALSESAHLSNLEQPEAFNTVVLQFLCDLESE